MKNRIIVFWYTLIVSLFFSGCSALSTPSAETMARLPVIKLGDKKPEHQEYIFFIPADTDMPIKLHLKGSLIAHSVEQTSTTRLNHALYLYKHWASLDGQHWQPRSKLVKMLIGIGVGPEGGSVKIDVDLLTKTAVTHQ